MLIDLKHIFYVEGEKLDINKEISLADYELYNCFPFITPVKICAQVSNVAGVVSIKGDLDFTFNNQCDRCMDEYKSDYHFKFSHTLCLKEPENDEDYILLDGYSLDLDEMAIPDVIMNLPTKFLCKDDCKGLCQVCGANKNVDACDCKQVTIDPRLEALGELLK